MKKWSKLFVLFLLLFVAFSCNKSKTKTVIKKYFSEEISLKVDSARLYGTLEMPDSTGQYPVVLIIAGSGPTDRNGNSKLGIKASSYRMLADSLSAHGIASVRYDKRMIGKSVFKGVQESSLRFDDYVGDAEKWIKKLQKDKRFTKVIVLGHSEGSLIGAIASNREKPAAFISVAGAGRPIDSVLCEQLRHKNYDMKEVHKIIKQIKAGKLAIVPENLQAIFRVTVQQYLYSWFKYVPRQVFSKLTIPVLIIQGTTDIQVTRKDAEALHNACKQSKLDIINGMNHVLKNASADTTKNIATYYNPKLPLNHDLVTDIVEFIDTL